MPYKLLVLWCFISQILFLRVFWEWSIQYLVYQPHTQLCGSFKPWNNQKQNWLEEWWKIISFWESKDFLSFDISSTDFNIKSECIERWYRFAGVPIGTSSISEQRKAAEFLASKKYIEKHFLNPSAYQLNTTLSRKELMKIILQISEKSVSDRCIKLFTDVTDDWGCKYIEAGLRHDFIATNPKFRPEASVSKLEAIKLIFKARAIDRVYNTDSWIQDYLSSAYYLGMTDTKISNYNTPILRGEIFQIIARSFPEFKKW